MRVLLIEDDTNVARSIELMLNAAGFNTYITDMGEEGIELARTYEYDVIVLDVHLPDMNGLRVVQAMRNAKVNTPIVMLSGDHTVDLRVRALGFGADDYMTKPFHKDELVARLHSVVRRSHAHSRSLLTIGELVLDLDSKTASVSGNELALTTKEFQMLQALCLRKGMTLSKDTLLSQLYGGMDEPDPKIIDVFICKLRKKIEIASHGQQYIRTVWGRGYQIMEPSTPEALAA